MRWRRWDIFPNRLHWNWRGTGYEICFIDYERMYESMDEMLHFLEREETALVTFNFIGLRGESVFQTESGRSIWQEENLPILNILVDPSLYYHSCLKEAGEADAGILCGQRARRLCDAVLTRG